MISTQTDETSGNVEAGVVHSPAIFSVSALPVPATVQVYSCSLLDHLDELNLAVEGANQLRLAYSEPLTINLKTVYMSPWNSHEITGLFFPLAKVVIGKIHEACKKFLNSDLSGLGYKLQVAQCWTASYAGGDHALQHDHFPSDFSAVVYLQMEESSSPIVFENAVEVRPRAGTLIFFPGHVKHHVPPSAGPRTVLVLNFFKIPLFYATRQDALLA